MVTPPFYVASQTALETAGIRLIRRGPHRLPPWHADHSALPSDFENGMQVEEELGTRQRLLRADGSAAAARLSRRLQLFRSGPPIATLASPLFYRWARVRFVAGVMRWLGRHPGPYLFVTFIPPAWFVPAGQLDPVAHAARKWRERFRKHLNDAGRLPEGAWMIGGLHASYEHSPSGQHTGYQFHYHAITTPAAGELIEVMRQREAYVPTEWVAPTIRRQWAGVDKPIVGAVTYLVKNYWPQRNSRDANSPGDMVRAGSRIPPPYHTEALEWADGQKFGDTILGFNGPRLPRFVYEAGW